MDPHLLEQQRVTQYQLNTAKRIITLAHAARYIQRVGFCWLFAPRDHKLELPALNSAHSPPKPSSVTRVLLAKKATPVTITPSTNYKPNSSPAPWAQPMKARHGPPKFSTSSPTGSSRKPARQPRLTSTPRAP